MIDKLAAAARGYHDVRRRLQELASQNGWAVSIARAALVEQLEAAENRLHEAAMAYGETAGTFPGAGA